MELTKDIICPHCGEAQKYRIYAGISGIRTPRLKQMILEETLFDWKCSRCGYFANMAYPLMYNDPQAGYVVCLDLVEGTNKVTATEQMQDMKLRMVKNPAELKEKILIFDSGYDDVAMELVKGALCDIVRGTYQVKRVHAYFSRENQGELEFAVFLPGKNEPVYHSTRVDVYKQSEEVLKSMAIGSPSGFVRVDARLARKIMLEFQNMEQAAQ